MSRGDVGESLVTAKATPALGEFNPEMLKMPTNFDKTAAASGDFVLTQAQVQAPGEGAQISPAQKLMDETVAAARKELEERKSKNGTLSDADFKEILPKHFPKMKEAISLADQQAAEGRRTAEAEYKRVGADLAKFTEDFPKAMERLGKASSAVPEAEQEKVGALLTELTEEKTSAQRKEAIRKDLEKYPDLAASAENVMKMSTDSEKKLGPLFKAVEDMQVGLATGLTGRGFYAACLRQANGDPQEIERVVKEGQALAKLFVTAMQAPQMLFMPPEDLQPKKPLPPVLKA
ncbi:MAG TPA: hypothetical protein PKZ32_20280 [Candidatus Melainabacteria bacterium]|nr:hypothetical protein [Candidatus Melainabacteria bacterium]